MYVRTYYICDMVCHNIVVLLSRILVGPWEGDSALDRYEGSGEKRPSGRKLSIHMHVCVDGVGTMVQSTAPREESCLLQILVEGILSESSTAFDATAIDYRDLN
jgi:hypothetical protein